MASSSVVPRESQLYNSLFQMVKPSVWVVMVTGTKKKGQGKVERFGTAFAVTNKGLIVSCAHIFRGLKDYVIEARGLDMEGITSNVKVIELCNRWDLCLMKVEGIVDCKIVELASDGSLYQGETLICISNPCGYVGSFGLGHALFPCVQNVTIPTNYSTCFRYDPSSSMEVTPGYRVMGHIWNNVTISTRIKAGLFNKDDYYTALHPSIPIIQCGDISSGEGCIGAPVINTRGEVVGILASHDRADQIAIHVTLIAEFLKPYLE